MLLQKSIFVKKKNSESRKYLKYDMIKTE